MTDEPQTSSPAAPVGQARGPSTGAPRWVYVIGVVAVIVVVLLGVLTPHGHHFGHT